MRISNPAIPLDSVVVVIGANGFIALETCEKLLQAGYRVRGTVRDVQKHHGWMHALFDKKWPGKFELELVADFEEDAAFDRAFKGATGVMYVSTPIAFDAEPANFWDPVVKGTINTLEAAARAGVKRYVLSSSSKAVESTRYNDPHNITAETWNHEELQKAKSEPTVPTFERTLSVYSAGRTLAELAFWSWIRETNPPFVANCVVPDGNFGRLLDAGNTNTTAKSSNGMLKRALQGDWQTVLPKLAYFVDVQDTARLLVAAVGSNSIANERIFAYRHQATWNDLRRRVRELYPDRPGLVRGEDLDIDGRDLSNAEEPIRRAEEILKEVGASGFTSETDILRDFITSLY